MRPLFSPLVETRKPVSPQTLLEQIPVNRLSRGRALPRGDDHLAIRRGKTTRGIQPRNAGSNTGIDDDLPFGI